MTQARPLVCYHGSGGSVLLHGLSGKVMLSEYRSPLYDKMFDGWRRLDVPHFADGALPRTESLWFNWL